MYKIKVTFPYTGEVREYVSQWLASTDKVEMLGYSYVLNNCIDSTEWARSKQTIAARFSVKLEESYIDGRSEEAKALPLFTWADIIKLAKSNIDAFHESAKP